MLWAEEEQRQRSRTSINKYVLGSVVFLCVLLVFVLVAVAAVLVVVLVAFVVFIRRRFFVEVLSYSCFH